MHILAYYSTKTTSTFMWWNTLYYERYPRLIKSYRQIISPSSNCICGTLLEKYFINSWGVKVIWPQWIHTSILDSFIGQLGGDQKYSLFWYYFRVYQFCSHIIDHMIGSNKKMKGLYQIHPLDLYTKPIYIKISYIWT